MELTAGEMEGEDLGIIQHPFHDHRLVLRESLQGDDHYGGGGIKLIQVECDGCTEPISSSSSYPSSSSSSFYACPIPDCWFLLHKRCAELPPTINHPSDPDDALTLSPHPLSFHRCDVCDFIIDGFQYHSSESRFRAHVRCVSMGLHIQDRVDEEHKIHKHRLIPLAKEAQFLCDACGREHEGKSYLCPTCGFWTNQICASAPTTIHVDSHFHPLILYHSFRLYPRKCNICNKVVKNAYWAYFCSKGCEYLVHVGCSLSEAENSNKDIQTNLHSESTSHKIDIPRDPKKEIKHITWPMWDESIPIITQLVKNLSLQGTHERATKILHCRKGHQLKFVDESKDDQQCDGCKQIISSQFYQCSQCNFSLHKWCAMLPEELQHIFHHQHPLRLLTQQEDIDFPPNRCEICNMFTDGFVFACSTCEFYLDLKCALLPRLIKHQAHDHDLALRRPTNIYSCNACGLREFSTYFRCEPCGFGLCIKCSLLPRSARHRYDKHLFALTYSPIKGQLDEYYCEICEEDIKSMYWFYHCIECNQSLHPKCIYHID